MMRNQGPGWFQDPTKVTDETRALRMRPHYVYRYFNDYGPYGPELLYIGCTVNLYTRDNYHRNHVRSKEWHAQSTRLEVEGFPDYWTAVRAEAQAIHNETPIYNVDYNGRQGAAA